MKLLLIGFTVFVFSFSLLPSSEATSIKVLKSKGNRAVVAFPKGWAPRRGDKFEVSKAAGPGFLGGTPTSRNYTVGLDATSFVMDLDNNNSIMQINANFGWNKAQYEFGGIFSFYNTENLSRFGIGGFGDYNLVKNTGAHKYVYGATARYVFYSQDGASFGDLRFGGSLKSFVLGNSTAVRIDALYRMQMLQDTSTSALVFAAGLQTYF